MKYKFITINESLFLSDDSLSNFSERTILNQLLQPPRVTIEEHICQSTLKKFSEW